MTAWEGLNRRKFPRVNFPCLVTVHNQDDKEVILTHTENVGIGGICIVFKKNVKMFAPVELQLDLIDGEEHIKCKGKVVWSIRRKSSESVKPFFYDIGIEFVDLVQADFRRIENTIQKLVKKGYQSSLS